MRYALLLTGTIDASVFNNVKNMLTDVKERLDQYTSTIKRYIKESSFDKIVFVENSGYSIDEEHFFQYAKAYGKEFEYLPFLGEVENVIKYGKSYGEAQCIRYGIEHSKLLEKEEYIYKVTGRVFLRNSKDICKSKAAHHNEFVALNDTKWCFTNFFKIRKEDFLLYLSDAQYECDDFNRKGIERIYYKRLLDARADVACFRNYPDLTGIVGGTGGTYDKSKFELIVLNGLSRVGYFNIKETDAKLLKIIRYFKQKK